MIMFGNRLRASASSIRPVLAEPFHSMATMAPSLKDVLVVRDEQIRIDLLLAAETLTIRAGAVRRVE